MTEPSTAPPGRNDLARIVAYFEMIDDDAIVAVPPDKTRITQDNLHDDLVRAATERGLAGSEWSGLGWHQQSADRAFEKKQLIAPLAIHWVGDHATVAAALAGLGAPYTVRDEGPELAFFVDPAPAEDDGSLPDIGDTAGVRKLLDFLDDEQQALFDPSTDHWPRLVLEDEVGQWLVEVIRNGSPKVAASAVSFFELTEPTVLEAVMARWAELAKELDWLVERLLEVLRTTGDERHDDVLAAATSSTSYSFRSGAVAEWTVIGGKEAQRHLNTFARKKNPVFGALGGWIDVTARLEDRPMMDVATDVIFDPKRTDEAHKDAFKHICHSLYPESGPLRVIRGALDVLDDDTLPRPLRQVAFDAAVTDGEWRDKRPGTADLRGRLLPRLAEYGADVHPVTLQWHRDQAAAEA